MASDNSVKNDIVNSCVRKLMDYTKLASVPGWKREKKFNPEISSYANTNPVKNSKGKSVRVGLDCDFRLEPDEAAFIGSIFIRGNHNNPAEVDLKAFASIMRKAGLDLHPPTKKDSKRYEGRYRNRLVWKMNYSKEWTEIIGKVNQVKEAVNAHLAEIAELV